MPGFVRWRGGRDERNRTDEEKIGARGPGGEPDLLERVELFSATSSTRILPGRPEFAPTAEAAICGGPGEGVKRWEVLPIADRTFILPAV